MTRRAMTFAWALALILGCCYPASAHDQAAAIAELKREMQELRREVSAKDRKIEDLERRLDAVVKIVYADPDKAPVKPAKLKPEPAPHPEHQAFVVQSGRHLKKANIRGEMASTPESPDHTEPTGPGKKSARPELAAASPPAAATPHHHHEDGHDHGEELTTVSAATPAPNHDHAVSDEKCPHDHAPKPDLWSRQIGKAKVRLMDICADLMVATGTSTATDQELQYLQGGGHDPRKRGFTLQQLELGLAGAVDPYFNAQAFLLWSVNPITNESIVELEEAYFTTQNLPFRLQGKGGYFLTEFGRINPTHPHAWNWLDQPVIATRLFGPDGLRAAGARLSWQAPVPWHSALFFSVQNANNLTSFQGSGEEADAHGHAHVGSVGDWPTVDRPTAKLKDMLYLARWENARQLNSSVSTKLGFSGLYGPNSTGSSGQTWIYGADLMVKWHPGDNVKGWPFLLWESEIMKRDYLADNYFLPGDTAAGIPDIYLAQTTFRDWGLYTQLLWGFHPGWALGLRYEWASGTGNDVHVHADDGEVNFISRRQNPYRCNRTRLSPLLAWYPSEYSRIRLQYNYDWSANLNPAGKHTVWLGFEVMYGAHPAHKH